MSLETFTHLSPEKKDRILSEGIRAFSRKCYKEVSTDAVTQACGISKGILFHYFGSKKGFYLYCLETSMERLTAATEIPDSPDFYETLFRSMSRKMALCREYPDEMHMVNMASRDASADIAREKILVLQKYKGSVQSQSMQILHRAVAALPLKEGDRQRTAEGLYLYIHAVLNQYLLKYQTCPDEFFEKEKEIRDEIKEYLDLMLHGICRKEAL